MHTRVPMRLGGSALAVVGATLLVYALKPVVPLLSLGAVYLLAVLPVATAWGIVYALPTSVACMLAFNWFFLPPVHSFTLSDSSNWAALGVYCATAVVVSELAARARRRAADAEQREREASLLAQVAGQLLASNGLERQLTWIGDRSAAILGASRARVQLDDLRVGHDEQALALEIDGRRVGSLVTPAAADPGMGVRRRFLPALAALLAVAVDRGRLEREAVEAEALRRSDVVKTTLLRAVSHDLRSPLTGITTAVGALRSLTLELSDEDRRELLETIAVDAARLERLVEDLLDLSRLEAGGVRPEAEVWALHDLVREAVDGLSGHERVVVAGRGPLVEVDAVQIERVLANLVENALKFSPPASLVHVQLSSTSREATARVVDLGAGVPPDELERIFEPFHRIAGRQSSGAGLGLAIARGFAEANGGRVWAESRPGQGATFALALPLATVPAELVA